MSRKDWVKNLKALKERIENIELNDRLSYTSALTHCLAALYTSLHGWYRWLSHPDIMNLFSKEELEELLDEFKDFTLSFLDLDIKWTKKKRKDLKNDKAVYIR